MRHYLAIFVPKEDGEWRVLFPDVPGCEAHGFSPEAAEFAAASALQQCIQESGSLPPPPMDLAAVQLNDEWLTQNQIDLSKAVVTMVSLAA
jgi:predicted RNase H-like HicB family nuclease